MPIQFPSTPTLNQTYTDTNGRLWRYNGRGWTRNGLPANLFAVSSNIIPGANVTYDLGSAESRWRDLYLSGNSLIIGGATVSATGSALQIPAGSTVGGTSIATTTDISTGGGPKITNIQVTNNTYTVLDDTAVDTAGGYIKLTGTNFAAGCSVLINNVPAASVTFVSSTEVRAQVPATAAGTYVVYLVNADGGVAIRVNGITFSGTPAWVTASTLPEGTIDTGISIQLLANLATTYSLAVGSTLPAGLTLSNVGLLSGTVTGLTQDTSYSFTVVATDAESQDSPRTFTITIAVSDPYFRNVALLLSGNSGNTVITDSSVNNFAITPVGDSRASNFSPYLTGWSNYFDGSGDYLTLASNSAFAFGTGDFTWETWFYSTGAVSSDDCFYDLGAANSAGGFAVFTTGSLLYVRVDGSNDLNYSLTSTWINTWHHLAVARSSGTVTVYLDGNSIVSGSRTQNITQSSPYIGGSVGVLSVYPYLGYLSNMRVVKGTALYTANFTPATTTLTAVANTSLLTCHANRLADGSANNFAITRNGDVRVESFNPFNLTNTGTTGSMYFDGTGDYLTLAPGASFQFGTGDFSIECWFNTTRTVAQYIIDARNASQTSNFFLIVEASSGTIYYTLASPYSQVSVVTSIPVNTWHHIVFSRLSGTVNIFFNGTRIASVADAGNYSTQPTISYIGTRYNNTEHFLGYISDLRIIKGSSPYSGTTLTLPNGPLTAIANTQLLTLQRRQPPNNHAFQDSSSNNFLVTRSGNATQGAFSPFSQSGWSNYFNGSSYISSPGFNFSNSNFTIEFFINTSSIAAGPQPISGYTSNLNYAITLGTGGVFRYYLSSNGSSWDIALEIVLGTATAGRWHHIVIVRSGNSIRGYFDGIGGSLITSSASIYNNATAFYMGAAGSAGGNLTGYISNVRILLGTAAYNPASSNITVPTSAFATGTTNQVLLTCQANRFVDNNTATTAKAISINGSPSVHAFSPFAPTATYSAAVHGGSAYFDGTGDYIEMPYNTAFKYIASQNFCLECWAYAISALTTNYIVSQVSSANWGIVLGVGVNTSGRIGLAIGNATTGSIQYLDDTEAFVINQWNHVVICRTGSTLALFVNGVRKSSVTNSNALNLTTDRGIRIGAHQDGTAAYLWPGYLSNIRSVVGSNPYDATQTTLTIPTGPLTAIANTSILFNFANDAIEDATGRNVIETVGDARTTSAVSKWAGAHSMSFDGTGDYLFIGSTPLYNLGTNNFTIEFWCYTTVNGAFRQIISSNTSTWSSGAATIGGTGGGGAGTRIRIGVFDSSPQVFAEDPADTPLNQWVHYAFTRNGNTFNLYKNGANVAVGTSSVSINFNHNSGTKIGGANWDGASSYWNGYIQDLRITQGVVRYTSNFSVPTQPFLGR